jgi:asparagine synthase (glutamine-hydrolysing)
MLSERDLSEEEAVAEVLRLLRLSIRRRMVSDVPFGVLLSGGVDSSLNVALMSELMERPVTTFTIGYEGLEEVNEFEFARRVSRRYRTEHHETRINHKQAQDFLPLLVRLQDEPIADNVCIPLYFLAELVRRSGTTVVQVGEGADEHFLGYWWCEHYRRKERETYDPARRQRSAWAALLARIRGDLSASAEDEEIRTRARAGQELFWGGAVCWWGRMREQLTPRPARFQQEVQCPAEGLLPEAHQRLDSHAIVKHYLEALPNGGAAFDVLRKIPYLEMKVRLPEHLLMRVDKLTMAHSIEARVPFLDHDLVDFATKLPATYKLREGVGKYLLKRAAEPYLDADMIYRRKQGFGAPMEQWFREGDFGQRCLAAFERSQIRKEGFLDNQYVEGLLRAQIGGAGGYSFHIWTILNAVLWHEVWIQGNLNCI